MKLRTQILALLVATALIGAAAAMNLQQASAFGFVERQQIGEFQKLTAQFKTDVIDAVLQAPPEPDKVLRLLNAYGDGVERIFLGGPDTVPGLLEQYQQAVLRVFVAPPEGDKRAQQDQIKEFRLLTHAFEKAVISAISDPED